MTTIKSLDQFLEVQLQTWVRLDERKKMEHTGPLIAITRQPGAGGEGIAMVLARELGFVLYDKTIVEQIAMDARVSEQMVATLDEKVRSELNEWLSDLAGGDNLSAVQYMQSLRRVLFTIAAHGDAVILGRGANFLLPRKKRTVGLYLLAPLQARVQNIMDTLCLSREAALEDIRRRDQAQRAWVKVYCNADIDDITNYQIAINTALVKTESIVNLIREMIKA